MKKLTVFTPTYNRAYCLHVCYESLKRQTSKDFVWLIIDDGSTDNTEQVVAGWISENEIQIRYHRQENQGMHGAHNTAYRLIDTELNVCIDSDDYMPDGAVEQINAFWEIHGSEHVSGIVGLDSFTDGRIIGTKLPENMKRSTLFQLYSKHGVTGDKKLVYRTALTREYPYPIFENEKYVGLAYKYYKLDEQYELLLMNEVLCCVEYLLDGSSMNMLKQYRKNPKGFAFYRKELMKLPFASSLFKFRQSIHYVSSSLTSGNRNFMKETPAKLLTLLAIPLGVMLYWYVIRKTSVT
ncbi:glycosyltransferase family 2 protein [Paenibacillus sp. CGMCC 1.16610]|uniref:Glycosyltransferase n=1 Tax=Paenibacillus anseongense TaxID=2682845 RepID=A0ABW9U183_9BACL|nr:MULTISPECIES: glycosyltransferase family 2 protein [Paenibacillus]MBA2943351.1 glycosyltransferase family 2 protein [Paenibacillus sp. CGMCC 1.16610]MVQ33849.1 glycosyltransferase [Paenibacillus anseongense]